MRQSLAASRHRSARRDCTVYLYSTIDSHIGGGLNPETLIQHVPANVHTYVFTRPGNVGDVVMSSITFAELSYGVSVCANPSQERHHLAALVEDIPVLPFDAAAATAYGPVREATRERRKDHLDKLIASHAISLDVTLVTNNERDFAAYPGLRMENWLNT